MATYNNIDISELTRSQYSILINNIDYATKFTNENLKERDVVEQITKQRIDNGDI